MAQLRDKGLRIGDCGLRIGKAAGWEGEAPAEPLAAIQTNVRSAHAPLVAMQTNVRFTHEAALARAQVERGFTSPPAARREPRPPTRRLRNPKNPQSAIRTPQSPTLVFNG